jgi:pimeloyl-ACP methyl ester carboxylesterase
MVGFGPTRAIIAHRRTLTAMLNLHVRTYGDGARPAIVMLHGLFGSSTNWGSVARQLAGRYFLLVPDLRNHGQSPHHPDSGYPAMVDDLLGLLDQHGLADATLVGHSMGGKVAMHLALTHPQRVTGLAVVDMAPVRYTHNFAGVLAGFNAVDLTAIHSRTDADAQMAKHVTGSGVRAFLLQNLVKRSAGWAWRLNLDALAAAQREITGFPPQPAGAQFAGPTSFIYGDQSDYVTPAYLSQIQRYFPDAVQCQVAQAGHWVYADQPQGFMSCLVEFLTRV